ncbi:MAG: tetratricopeptide repeat protein, partial [Pseudomonadota bacterium]
ALTSRAPHDRWAWYDLASAYANLGRYDDVAKAARRALEIEPDPAQWSASWIYYLYAKALYRTGQYAQAAEVAKLGEVNASTWRSTFFRMALGQAKADADTDVSALVDEYIRISEAEGRNDEAYTAANIALFYFELGDYAKAAQNAQKSWDLKPQAYPFWVLVYSLAEAGKTSEALAFVNENGAQFDTHAFPQAAIGWARYRAGQVQAAQASYMRATSLLKRRNYQIETQRAVVDAAVGMAQSKPANPLKWLG